MEQLYHVNNPGGFSRIKEGNPTSYCPVKSGPSDIDFCGYSEALLWETAVDNCPALRNIFLGPGWS